MARMLAPINAVKHYVQKATATVASGVTFPLTIAEGVVAPAVATVSDCKQGAVIKAFYLEMWIAGFEATGTSSQFVLIVEKTSGGQVAITNAQMLLLSAYPNKKNVLYTTQGVLGASIDGNQSVPVFRAWIKIPKGKQRLGLGDKIVVNVSATGDLRTCGFATYKEYI